MSGPAWSPISALRDSEAAAERERSNGEKPRIEEIRSRLKEAFRERRVELTPSDYRAIGLAARELHEMGFRRLKLKRWLNDLARQPIAEMLREIRRLARQGQS